MRTCFDSSAFAKRYIRESGSEQVEEICLQTTALAVSAICLPEIISALCRLRREKVLRKSHYERIKRALMEDLEGIIICNITPEVIGRAVRLLEANPLRAMDALHVACALEWEAEIFVSADRQQIAAAEKTGLRVMSV